MINKVNRMRRVPGHVGIYRRTAASGISSLYITYKINHNKVWKLIGPEPVHTPAMAKDIRDKHIADAQQLLKPKPFKRTLTLDQAFKHFSTTYAEMQLITGILNLTHTYKKHLQSVWGSTDLSQITPVMINRQKVQWLKAVAPTAVNQILSLLSRIYSAVGFKNLGLYSGTNPVSQVKKLSVDDTRLRFLTKKESLQLLATLRNQNLRIYQQCAFALYAGLRKMEIMTLRAANIDLENSILTIRTKDKKQGRFASLPILPKLRSIIEEMYAEKYYAPNERLFPADKFNYKAFYKAVDACGLNKDINWEDKNLSGSRFRVVLHTLRHTFASHLIASGIPISVVQRLMRHSSIKSTEVYSHVHDSQLKDAIGKLEDSWKEADETD